jgi:hypothetical protein
MTVLLVLGTVGLRLSQTDLLISRNLLVGTQALWLARAGTAIGKNWLEANLSGALLPVTLGPEALTDGTYTVTITDLGAGAYRLTSVGLGPEDSQRVVEVAAAGGVSQTSVSMDGTVGLTERSLPSVLVYLHLRLSTLPRKTT